MTSMSTVILSHPSHKPCVCGKTFVHNDNPWFAKELRGLSGEQAAHKRENHEGCKKAYQNSSKLQGTPFDHKTLSVITIQIARQLTTMFLTSRHALPHVPAAP